MNITTQDMRQRSSDEVDDHLERLLEQLDPFIANVARYFFGWVDTSFQPTVSQKGKKLRSTLNLLVYEAIIGSHRPALPLAAALELLHTYSLIHDDIIDRDSERRGRPTVWKIWGDGMALNCGDALHALAFQSLTGLVDSPAAKILELCSAFITASIRLTEGQHLDISFEKAMDVSEKMYLAMIARKTAALIEYATYSAAFLATTDQDLITSYQKFGYNLGMAFQIRDDYLNIWGDPKTVGKPQYGDLTNRKKTLPIIYTLQTQPTDKRTSLVNIYNSDSRLTDSELTFVLDCFAQAETKAYTEDLISHYTDGALAWLNKGQADNPAQSQLRILTNTLAGRDF